jgi:hypothetical protein
MTIETYLANISRLFKTGNAREHSYRGDLQALLGSILPDILVTNEPARIACGAPDYVLTRKGIPVGYVEAKDIGVNLADKKLKEQFDRYRLALSNLIITDYIHFHFYKDGGMITSIALAELLNNEIVAIPENFSQFIALVENFSRKISGTNIITKPHYADSRVYINETQYFDNVPQAAWEFYIGGYQPAQKWLKDRSGRTLDYDDISHYQKIIAALEATGRIMGEIDEP